MSAPADAAFHPSSFGGGWIVPNCDEAREYLENHFGEPPVELPPIGGVLGYIVEPHDALDVIKGLMAIGCEVTL